MHRFFADKHDFNGENVKISGGDALHIINVLRLKTGDCITVCDGCSTDFICEICEISKKDVTAKICESAKNTNEPPCKITLFQALPKSDKMDFIVQKSVELGVWRIVPIETARSVVKIKDSAKKCERWNKISREASKQCGRGVIPQVLDVQNFKDAVAFANNIPLKIFAYELEQITSLRMALAAKQAADTAIFIGAEGGFEPYEAECAVQNGFTSVSLGPRILRCETAPIAVLSALMYQFEQ